MSVMKLFVGDMILLEAGMRVPADCIIIDSHNLKVDEDPGDEVIETKAKSA